MTSSSGDKEKFSLTSFLFGNVDSDGNLENDVLDETSKKHLSSLSELGFKCLLAEIVGSEETGYNDDISSIEDIDMSDCFDEKLPCAVDFSDITELASETDSQPSSIEGLANSIPESNVNSSSSDAMSVPLLSEDNQSKKKLDTPLAGILPPKYADVDVRELFPEFSPNKVLRFSRLFGCGKGSSSRWKLVKKRMKCKKPLDQDISDTDESNVHLYKKGWVLNIASPPLVSELSTNDEDKFLKPETYEQQQDKENENSDNLDLGPRAADWRFGPAQLWYDMLNVPENGEGFDYGFKVMTAADNKESQISIDLDYPDEAFLMISQANWESDVIWNGEEIKHKVLHRLNSRMNAAGWIPTSSNRIAQNFSQSGKGITSSTLGSTFGGANRGLGTNWMNTTSSKSGRHSKQAQPNLDDNADEMLYSIFPVQNEELTYGLWEDEIIWDAQAIRQVPKPKILTLDPNDENIILGIPSDVDPAKQRSNSTTPVKVKIAHPHVKKSKILLGKAGVINVLEEDAPPSPAKSPDHDPFNVSNDKYYMSKSAETSLRISSANLIQHSTPVIELRAPFVQTHMGPMRLRNFHRPSIKRYSHGALAQPHKHCVTPLAKYIKKKAKQRENERIAAGGGDIFFMRTAEDLTGRDADLILVEFSEEHPPLVNLVGMCSKIKNYYKRKAAKDQGPQEYKYGEVAYAHTSPFLGMLAPGKSIQTLENNMYRVPIFEHEPCETDFLVIRTRNQYFIREFNGIFVAGQLCPLYEVPSPNSKRANNFVRDFLQVFIYRLFWKSKSVPRRLCMDEVKKAFPSHSESSIRKRLKLCADFKRTGTDSNLWVIKPDFRLPPEDEIRAMVSPEQCCAHFSMMAAEQRLKDAGYGEKFLFTPQEEDDDDLQLKMDDEIKVAPWNTTRAYIQAMKGKCLLQLTGPADPTGCGEGFSYVRVPNKPVTRQNKEEHKSQPKRIVTGTDADLRRLSLNNAKALLRKCGIAEEEIKKLSRWEVIDVVRTLSTEKAKAGEEGMTKFSRGNRFSIAEHQERYKEECQRIFDLQNKVLSSNEILSTDEDESTDEENDSDIEEMGKNIENMLSNKKTSSQLTREREEQERQQLRKLFIEDSSSATTDKKDNKKKLDDENTIASSQAAQMGRVLKIYRTFRDPEGKEYTRLEVVRKPAVIDAYQKIRNTKDDEFIKNFALLDDAQKEEMKREKRRIQEQLRRIKRNQIKEGKVGQFNFDFLQRTKLANAPSEPNNSAMTSSGTVIIKHRNDRPSSSIFHHKDAASANSSSSLPPIHRRPKPMKPDLKVRCGACGATGHMRTNKACPKFSLTAPMAPVVVALTQEEEHEFAKQLNDDAENLVNVEGTKLTLSSRLIKHAEDVKKRSLKLKVPKQFLHNARKRKAAGTDDFCDYLKKHKKPTVRRCTDPVVDMSTIFESILNEMRQPDDVQPFLFPVNAKAVPDYYKIVQRPMDLQTMRKNLLEKKYQTREEFLADVNQIVENSTIYNGAKSILTLAAENMLKVCVERLAENEDRLMHLEKTINPLLDDNDQVALSFILASILNKIKTMSESWPFLKPVNKRMVKDYYEIVKRPVDLQTIHNNIAGHKYHSRYEFLDDVELIAKNCLLYNGGTSTFTGHAQTIFKFAQSSIAEYDDYLQTLEEKLKVTRNRVIQQRAQEDAMSDDASMQDFSSPTAIVSESPDNINNSSDMAKEIQLEADVKDFVKTEMHQLLEDDLHCSSEDEDLMEEVKGLEQLEVGIGPDFESQQVAEAMMQLGNFAYNTSTSSEEKQQPITSKWLPENNEEDTKMLAELSLSNPVIGDSNPAEQDLEISESDEDELLIQTEIKQESAHTKSEQPENMDDDNDGLWF